MTYCNEHGISLEHFTSLSQNIIKRSEENVFVKNSSASQAVLRRWYEKGHYTEYKCAICGQPPEWNGKPLTLTLDHIDGDNKNDVLENLRWVCPNCDRQLDTFCSKNISGERVNARQNFYCKVCGKEISHGSTYCPDCYAISIRKVEQRPSANELIKILKENKGNFTRVAQIFNVSDNAIRKWCRGYNIPDHSKDYK